LTILADPDVTTGWVLEQIFTTSPADIEYGEVLISPQQGLKVTVDPSPLSVTSQLTQPPVKQSAQPPSILGPNSSSGVTVVAPDVWIGITFQQRPSLPKKTVSVPPVNKLKSTI
jgi:hypothetical protein